MGNQHFLQLGRMRPASPTYFLNDVCARVRNDDKYQDRDPDPAIPEPVTVHAFYNPRGCEGPKATTVTRIAPSTLAILATVDTFQTPRPFEGLAETTNTVNCSIGRASRASTVTTLEFVDTRIL